jgi:hypothetical protein
MLTGILKALLLHHIIEKESSTLAFKTNNNCTEMKDCEHQFGALVKYNFKDREKSGACSTHEKEEKCIKYFG